jgi:hypothetical protein
VGQRSRLHGDLGADGLHGSRRSPLAAPEPIKSVLIEENPKVWRSDFVEVLIAGFNRHGIDARVIQPGTPVGNAYVVKYTARQKWDMAMYMSDATIWIYKNDQEVAEAVYHLKGGGGFLS